MLHVPPTSLLHLAAKQEPYQRRFHQRKILNFLEKKVRRMGQEAEKDKSERAIGVGRGTRQEIVKWNQMTALRFQTRGRHQTSPASLREGLLTYTDSDTDSSLSKSNIEICISSGKKISKQKQLHLILMYNKIIKSNKVSLSMSQWDAHAP